MALTLSASDTESSISEHRNNSLWDLKKNQSPEPVLTLDSDSEQKADIDYGQKIQNFKARTGLITGQQCSHLLHRAHNRIYTGINATDTSVPLCSIYIRYVSIIYDTPNSESNSSRSNQSTILLFLGILNIRTIKKNGMIVICLKFMHFFAYYCLPAYKSMNESLQELLSRAKRYAHTLEQQWISAG